MAVRAAQSGCTGSPSPPGWNAHIYGCTEGLLCVLAQSETNEGDARRLTIRRTELGRAVARNQYSKGTGICSCVKKKKMTTGVHFSDHTVLWSPALTAQHCVARLAFATEHQSWQIRTSSHT